MKSVRSLVTAVILSLIAGLGLATPSHAVLSCADVIAPDAANGTAYSTTVGQVSGAASYSTNGAWGYYTLDTSTGVITHAADGAATMSMGLQDLYMRAWTGAGQTGSSCVYSVSVFMAGFETVRISNSRPELGQSITITADNIKPLTNYNVGFIFSTGSTELSVRPANVNVSSKLGTVASTYFGSDTGALTVPWKWGSDKGASYAAGSFEDSMPAIFPSLVYLDNASDSRPTAWTDAIAVSDPVYSNGTGNFTYSGAGFEHAGYSDDRFYIGKSFTAVDDATSGPWGGSSTPVATGTFKAYTQYTDDNSGRFWDHWYSNGGADAELFMQGTITNGVATVTSYINDISTIKTGNYSETKLMVYFYGRTSSNETVSGSFGSWLQDIHIYKTVSGIAGTGLTPVTPYVASTNATSPTYGFDYPWPPFPSIPDDDGDGNPNTYNGLTINPATGQITGTPTSDVDTFLLIKVTGTNQVQNQYPEYDSSYQVILDGNGDPVYLTHNYTESKKFILKIAAAGGGATSPSNPNTPTAVAGDGSADITVSDSGSGGTPDSYLVTASPGGASCTVTGASGTCTISGLTNGTAYTFTATATNAGGTSGSSSASTAVTPTATNSGGGSSGSGSLAPGELGPLGPTTPNTPPSQGSSSTTIDGNPVKTSTSSSDSSDSVTTSNGGKYSSSLTFKDLDGDATVPLTNNETIGAEPGSDISVKGRGFKGRSQVQVYLIDANGNATYLGKIKTSMFGRVKGKLKVPANFTVGKYTLQVNGYTKKKQLVKSSNLGMEVVEDDLGSLYFESNSYKATEETKDAVKEMAKSLDAGETVTLYGYTSGNPRPEFREYNMYLAKKRTKTIKALFAAEGVQATIVIEPQGAVSPYGSNGGNANNRRVDVKPSS